MQKILVFPCFCGLFWTHFPCYFCIAILVFWASEQGILHFFASFPCFLSSKYLIFCNLGQKSLQNKAPKQGKTKNARNGRSGISVFVTKLAQKAGKNVRVGFTQLKVGKKTHKLPDDVLGTVQDKVCRLANIVG